MLQICLWKRPEWTPRCSKRLTALPKHYGHGLSVCCSPPWSSMTFFQFIKSFKGLPNAPLYSCKLDEKYIETSSHLLTYAFSVSVVIKLRNSRSRNQTNGEKDTVACLGLTKDQRHKLSPLVFQIRFCLSWRFVLSDAKQRHAQSAIHPATSFLAAWWSQKRDGIWQDIFREPPDTVEIPFYLRSCCFNDLVNVLETSR